MVVAAAHAQGGSSHVRVERRDIIVAESAEDGSRYIVDVMTLASGDSGAASWSAGLPANVIGLTVGEGDVPPSAVRHIADRVEVSTTLTSGRSRLVLQYVLPPTSRSWSLEVIEPIDTLTVVARDGDVVPRGRRFSVERAFGAGIVTQMHVTTSVSAGTVIEFAPAGRRGLLDHAWWIIVLASGVSLVGGVMWWALRHGALARARVTP